MSFYIIIRGPLGAGKSTIAKKIQARLKDARVFLVDRVLDDYGLTSDKEDGYISQKSFLKANEILAPEAEKLLSRGIPVIFDGNFYWKSQIDDLINRLSFKHQVFTLKAPMELCIKRDLERDKTHGKDAAEVVFKKSTQFSYGKEIDVAQSLAQCVDEIISLIPKS